VFPKVANPELIPVRSRPTRSRRRCDHKSANSRAIPRDFIGGSSPEGRVFSASRPKNVKTEARANARRRRARARSPAGTGDRAAIDASRTRRRYRVAPRKRPREERRRPRTFANSRSRLLVVGERDPTSFLFVPTGRRGTARCLGARSRTMTAPRRTTRSPRGAGNGGRSSSLRTGGSSPRRTSVPAATRN